MILDVVCIILSLFIRLIDNDKVTKKMEKKLLSRYLNLYEDDNPKPNMVTSVFSDKDAIEKVFTSGQST